jgi:hypothetical protein
LNEEMKAISSAECCKMVGSIGFFLAKWLVATPSYQKPSAHLIIIGETPVRKKMACF